LASSLWGGIYLRKKSPNIPGKKGTRAGGGRLPPQGGNGSGRCLSVKRAVGRLLFGGPGGGGGSNRHPHMVEVQKESGQKYTSIFQQRKDPHLNPKEPPGRSVHDVVPPSFSMVLCRVVDVPWKWVDWSPRLIPFRLNPPPFRGGGSSRNHQPPP